jgi:nucleoside-diphosphate-sugar epimerase
MGASHPDGIALACANLWLPHRMVHPWPYGIVAMSQNVILITGAAGFLGSAITVALSREHVVIAVDAREPSEALRRAAPGVVWQRLDIADSGSVSALLRSIGSDHGRLDFLIHLAAFYHFGSDWLPEYERTNVRGTENVFRAARDASARRVIFASSIAAMEPPRPGEMLTERTPTSAYIPYARSKQLGEEMLAKEAPALPGIVLRVAGAFSDWCELPPLYSLIKRWSGRGPSSRLVPGRGNSGFPYIHRDDVVRSVIRCIECHATLAPFEVLLASPSGAVSHTEVFAAVGLAGRAAAGHPAPAPILIPPLLARLGLRLRAPLARLAQESYYEQPWMLDFVDRPWATDAGYTEKRLAWGCTPGMGILDRLPQILERFRADRRAWELRNRRRNEGCYGYSP